MSICEERLPRMHAGLRNVAWGGAIVMAAFLAVIVANCVWAAIFRLDVYILFNPWEGWLDVDLWPYVVSNVSGDTGSLVGFAVVVWLIARVFWGASKSIAAGRA